MSNSTDENATLRRPSMPLSLGSAPGKIMGPNGHAPSSKKEFVNGIQVVDSDGTFGYVQRMIHFLNREILTLSAMILAPT